MPSDNELLFGKLAVGKGYCTKENLEWCLAIQTTTTLRIPLGRILVQEGFLSEDQHSEILSLQRTNMTIVDPLTRKRRESVLFGKLAVREGLLTAAEANDCLTEQAAEGEKRSLGEIMISSGYLTAGQVQDLLGKQQKKIMSCQACALAFTVQTISQGKKAVLCPRCKGPLAETKSAVSTRTDAEFATQVLRATKRETPAGSQSDSRVISPNSPRVKTTCMICDQRIEGSVDSTGRVRCSICNATFVPK